VTPPVGPPRTASTSKAAKVTINGVDGEASKHTTGKVAMESSSVKGDLAKFSGENPVKKSIIRWFLLSCLKIEEIEYVDLKISKSQCLFLKDVFFFALC